MINYDSTSIVEHAALQRSGRQFRYAPTEKIPIIEVDDISTLGKVAALRFIEWVQRNSGGVVALPTGKSPEYFIKWVRQFLTNWERRDIRAIIGEYGIPTGRKPSLDFLRFVQIDEFYPMDSRRENSFHHFVSEFYLKGFGLRPERALLIDATTLGLPQGRSMEEIFPNNAVDLTLRARKPNGHLERLQRDAISRVDEFCMEYEMKIREMGGIGFFLGGIGPDGHIAFNVRGSGLHTVTRLTGTNFETEAAAAVELGGVEMSRNRPVITIGLATIMYNPTATAIVLASGSAKADVVALAVENPKHPQHPASVLQDLASGRFYLTRSAASRLSERRFEDFRNAPTVSDEERDRIAIRLSLGRRKTLAELTREDFEADRFGAELLRKVAETPDQLTARARDRLTAKIDKGLQPVTETTFLHAEAHYDDIMLSYLAYLDHLAGDAGNVHYIANLASGFTSVTNAYVLSLLRDLSVHLNDLEFTGMFGDGYFSRGNMAARMADVHAFLDAVAAKNPERQAFAESCRMTRSIIDVYGEEDLAAVKERVAKLVEYFTHQYHGAKDPPDIQTVKGAIREWEAELLWAYFGIESTAIHPLRLGLHAGDIFSGDPEPGRDAQPVLELLKQCKPDVVTVALDPEGSGKDTSYQALSAVAGALKLYEQETGDSHIRIWGYRSIQYRFDPSEASLIVPVSLDSLSMIHTSFMTCLGSQRAGSFPSYEHDGPLSELAQRIQVEQYQAVRGCLGEEYFLRSANPRLRAARGMIFLKEMTVEEMAKYQDGRIAE